MTVEFKEGITDANGLPIDYTALYKRMGDLNVAQMNFLGAASVTSDELATTKAAEDELDIGAIVGGCIGGLLFLLIIFFIIKKKTSAGTGYTDSDQPLGDSPMLEVPTQHVQQRGLEAQRPIDIDSDL